MAANFHVKQQKILTLSFKFLVVFLSISFLAPTLILFYLFFEASLIPIFWIILGWGYQPERLAARIIIFFYTLASSLPLLAALILIQLSASTLRLAPALMDAQCLNFWVRLSLMTAFLVKFPIYLVHIWLPKAHVEAPVSGSIILAGVLLKLGGYGIYLISLFILGRMNCLLISVIRMIGGSLLGILCCRVTDIKILIAYSSVVHMALIILNLSLLENIGLSGAWWLILAHGLVSSGIFAMSYILYTRTHSRSLILNKGLISLSPTFSFFWFLIIIINFAGPFTLNLLGEIIMISRVISSAIIISIPVAFLAFFSAAYGLLLYTSTQQGLPNSSSLSNLEILSREINLMLRHTSPILLLLLSLGLF